jgi:hypothetical protein
MRHKLAVCGINEEVGDVPWQTKEEVPMTIKTPTPRTAKGSSKTAKAAIDAARKSPASRARATTKKTAPAKATAVKKSARAVVKNTTGARKGRELPLVGRLKVPAGIVFTVNGEPRDEAHGWKLYSLSRMAYFETKDIVKGQPRVGVKELTAVLVKLGVENPYDKSWDVVLPNGHRVGAIVPGTPAAKIPAGADKAVNVRKRAATGERKVRSTRPPRPSTTTSPEVIARQKRLDAAKVESKAIAAWAKGGEKGKPPATPNLDALTEAKKAS